MRLRTSLLKLSLDIESLERVSADLERNPATGDWKPPTAFTNHYEFRTKHGAYFWMEQTGDLFYFNGKRQARIRHNVSTLERAKKAAGEHNAALNDNGSDTRLHKKGQLEKDMPGKTPTPPAAGTSDEPGKPGHPPGPVVADMACTGDAAWCQNQIVAIEALLNDLDAKSGGVLKYQIDLDDNTTAFGQRTL